MKRIISAMLCIVMGLSIFSLVGCSIKEEEDVTNRKVVDMLGKEVEIPVVVENYSVLYSSAVPICGMLDENLEHMNICPKGYGEWMAQIFPGVYDHAKIVDKKAVTAEEIIESGAQVVFWSQSYNEDVVAALEKIGIACVNVKISDEASAIRATEIIAEVFGTEYAKAQAEKYITLVKDAREDAEKIVAEIPEEDLPKVLVLGGADTLETFSKSDFEYYWASRMRLDFVFSSDNEEESANLTMEQIYEFDPDVIIFEGWTDVSTLYDDPAWSNLRAAKNKMLLDTPMVLNVWCKPGSEMPLMYSWIISTCYPDYANELDMERLLISYFNDMFGYNMTAEEAEIVLDGGIPSFE